MGPKDPTLAVSASAWPIRMNSFTGGKNLTNNWFPIRIHMVYLPTFTISKKKQHQLYIGIIKIPYMGNNLLIILMIFVVNPLQAFFPWFCHFLHLFTPWTMNVIFNQQAFQARFQQIPYPVPRWYGIDIWCLCDPPHCGFPKPPRCWWKNPQTPGENSLLLVW